MNLERMRSVLETLARSFTGRDNLIVSWGDVPYTDFKKIVLSRNSEIVPGVKCSPGELWLGLKANCAHESGHLIFTDKNVWNRYKDKPLRRQILNIIEDARVERSMANLFPGTLRWFRFLNEYIFLYRNDWTEMPPHEQALYGLMCYTIVGRLPELSAKELEFVSKCALVVDEGRISETTEKAAAAAEKAADISDIYIEYYGDRLPSRMRAPEACGTSRPRKSPKGDRDPRRKPVLPKVEDEKEPEPLKSEDEERPIEETEEKSAAELTPDETPEERRSTDEADETESVTKPEPEFEELVGESSGESTDTEQPEADGSGDAKESNEEETESLENGVEPAGKPDSEATEPEELKEEEPDTPKKPETDTEDALPEPNDELETPEDTLPESEEDADTESEDGDVPRGGTLESGIPGGDSSEALEDADADAEDIRQPGESVEDDAEELLTGMDDLMEESEHEVKAFRDEPEITIPEPSREEIEEAGRTGLMKHRLVLEDLPSDPKHRERHEKRLRPLAHRAAEEVRKILQGRHSVVRKNLRKGNLDPSALWKVPTGEPDIFRRRDLPGPKADVAVYLLIDCSGSMQSAVPDGPWPECVYRIDYRLRGMRGDHAAPDVQGAEHPACCDGFYDAFRMLSQRGRAALQD